MMTFLSAFYVSDEMKRAVEYFLLNGSVWFVLIVSISTE